MKSGEEAVYFLLDRMNEIGVDYMIVGSFSSNAYGIARATKDADFVVQTTEDKRRQLSNFSTSARRRSISNGFQGVAAPFWPAGPLGSLPRKMS